MSRRRGPTPKRDSRRSFWNPRDPRCHPAPVVSEPAHLGACTDCAVCVALAAGDTDAALAAFFDGPGEVIWET